LVIKFSLEQKITGVISRRCGFDEHLPRYNLLKHTPSKASVPYKHPKLAEQVIQFLEKIGTGEQSISFLRLILGQRISMHRLLNSN
jgi:hypothetical protein